MSEPTGEDMIGRDGLAAWLGVSVDSVDRLVRAGRLPRPFKLGYRLRRWDCGEVQAALEALRA